MSFLTFDESRDFPYYKHNPKISKTAWFILLVCTFLSFVLYALISFRSEFIGSIVFCFGILIPLLYFSNWDYTLLFHKLTRDEIILAVLMFLGYMVYAIVAGFLLDMGGLTSTITSSPFNVTPDTLAGLIFSMMGEELLKFVPLMILMRTVYKFTSNRKLAVIISAVLVMIGFGLIHYAPPYSTLVQVLVLQGFGTIFEMYGYIRTKNLFVPYLSHLLTDAFVFILMLFGVS